MKQVTDLTTIEMVDEFIKKNELSFLYVFTPECSTCHAIFPKLREVVEHYPEIKFGRIDATQVEEVAERFLILAAPILLLMISGKEYLRADRYVRFELLDEKLRKIYQMYMR
ncbi:thioredoxin family protein [Priestia flexa]|uniref:thioredoxin family protein n=1 Tax=Priestia flexa TaxID=86664 RepID=UPI00095556F8|nr:thioredoxin family protein [Priestia flexa]MBY6087280.1 thioredoxin family protein [Priestia flexa]WEZ06883.1 thioredoxin family protein [Priestia flexa]SIR25430.1 Thioredoxin [Priestia flexa]